MLRNIAIVSVALCLAVIAAYLTRERIAVAEGMVETRSYLAYAADADDPVARPGTVLSRDEVEIINVPASATERLGPLMEATEENIRLVTLQPLNIDVPRERFLTFDMFTDLSIPRLSQEVEPGRRLMTLSVDARTSLNFSIRPGDRIDLLGAAPTQGAPSDVVLEDVEVIAIDEFYSSEDFRASGQTTYRTITISVTQDEGRMVAARPESRSGGFSILMMGRCDSADTAPGCSQ